MVGLILVSGLCLLGCTSPDARTDGASALVNSLLAARTMFNTWQTDREAAEAAMQEFAKAPIAGAAMLAAPIDLGDDAHAGQRRHGGEGGASFPDCLAIIGESGCEVGTTLEPIGCSAGDFLMNGGGTRSCDVCPVGDLDDATCNYRWDVEVAFTSDEINAELFTRTDPVPDDGAPPPGQTGGVSIGPDKMDVSSFFEFELETQDGDTFDASLKVCSCGPLQFDASCEEGTSPVSGTLLVGAITAGHLPGATIIPGTCARVIFNSCGDDNWDIDGTCECPGGDTAVCP